MRTIGFSVCTIALMVSVSGCMTGPHIIENPDPWSNLEPGTPEWWASKAAISPGVKQRCKKGKIWPARPRPSGEGQQFSHTFHSAHYWPLPYVCADRQYAREIMEVQVSNGWTEETTLYHRHFDEVSQTLTRPGLLHLQRVLETTPLRYRAVYVQATRDPGLDDARIANIQTAIAELTGGTENIPVSLRSAREYTRPASEVEVTSTLYNNSIPAPRLAGAAGAGASAAGGGDAATQ